MNYTVVILETAREDLRRIFDHLLARELKRNGDLDYADQTVDSILASFTLLERFPFTCRKSKDNTFLRELIIPVSHTGYVALFEIVSAKTVVISAIRHQREDDYH